MEGGIAQMVLVSAPGCERVEFRYGCHGSLCQMADQGKGTHVLELLAEPGQLALGDQLKEATVGEYTILCDEAKSRRGGGTAPSPLQYFIAAIGF